MSFKDLPTELVWLIYEYLSPAEQFDVSCTSKHFTAQSKDLIAKHKQNHAVYHRASGHELKFLEHLLQVVVDDRSAIWHLRTFDALGAPPDCGYFINDVPDNSTFESFVAKTQPSVETVSRVTDDIVNDLRKQMKRAGEANLMGEVCRKASQGKFDAYEVLILALSPNLQAVNLANFPKNRVDEYSDQRTGDVWLDLFLHHIPVYRPLSLLCEVICNLHELPKPIWPPGFQSVRKIFIGSHGFESLDLYSVAPILMLPNIESIHVECLQEHDGWPHIVRDVLRPACSSVQHLSFGVSTHNPLDAVLEFATRARHLKTLVIKSRHRLLDVLGPLKAHFESSLERVIFHGKDCLASADWARSPMSMDDLAFFTTMQILSINLWDVMHGWAPPELFKSRFSSEMSPTTDHGSYVVFMLRLVAAIPRGLRVLILDSTHKYPFFLQDMRIVDDAFCRVIKDGLCPNLTEIYMDGWKDMVISETRYPCMLQMQSAVLPRTAALAKDRGIKVFTYESEGATDRFISTFINEQFRV